MPAASSTLTPGEEIFRPGARLGGRYAVQSVIAIGGMATVYRAWDERLGDECAIKAYSAEAIDADPDGERAFHEEALLLARLRHPGVVAVRDHFFERGHAFLVMDFVPGENLYERHRRTARPDDDPDDVPLSPIPESQVAGYGIAIAQTLGYLHSLSPPVIYRDLKPHNIICRSADRRLILLDFGIARFFKSAPGACDTEAMGTPGYAAPEQYDGLLQSDPRTDLYSLGVVLYELATGFNPRAEGAARKLPPPQEARPNLTSTFAAFLARCTAWERDSRYETADALIEDLRAWQSGAPPRRAAPPRGERPIWRFGTEAPILSPPALCEGTLFVADSRGTAYALDLASGQPRWKYRPQPLVGQPAPERATVARTTVCVSRDGSLMVVTFPCGEGLLGACLVDARTGTHRTTIKASMARQVYAQIVDAAATDHPAKAASDLVMALGSPNELVNISLAERTVRWRRPLACAPTGLYRLEEEPAAGRRPGGERAGRPERLLVTDSKGFAHAILSADGALLWSRRVCQGALVAAPYVDHERLVLGGAPGDMSLACLCPESGQMHWQVAIAGQLVAAPAIVDQTLVLPTRNAGLIGLDRETGATLWRRTEFSRPLGGATALPAGGLFALAEYGEGARAVIVGDNPGGAAPIWQALLPSSGSLVPPVVSDERLVALGVTGAICAWEMGVGRTWLS